MRKEKGPFANRTFSIENFRRSLQEMEEIKITIEKVRKLMVDTLTHRNEVRVR